MDYIVGNQLLLLLQSRYPGGLEQFFGEDGGSIITIDGIPKNIIAIHSHNFRTNLTELFNEFTANSTYKWYRYGPPAYDVVREEEIRAAITLQFRDTPLEAARVTLSTALVVIDISSIGRFDECLLETRFNIKGINCMCVNDGESVSIYERVNEGFSCVTGLFAEDPTARHPLAEPSAPSVSADVRDGIFPISADDITNLQIILGTCRTVEELLSCI